VRHSKRRIPSPPSTRLDCRGRSSYTLAIWKNGFQKFTRNISIFHPFQRDLSKRRLFAGRWRDQHRFGLPVRAAIGNQPLQDGFSGGEAQGKPVSWHRLHRLPLLDGRKGDCFSKMTVSIETGKKSATHNDFSRCTNYPHHCVASLTTRPHQLPKRRL